MTFSRAKDTKALCTRQYLPLPYVITKPINIFALGYFRLYFPDLNLSGPIITGEKQTKQVEDYITGYPALLSAYEPFFLCRRFDRLRARLLLLKQDRLSVLEQRLDQIDEQETSLLFLRTSRRDANADRWSLLSGIESYLADYDQFTERTHRVLGLEPTKPRNARCLQNWLNGTGCLVREEAAYLAHSKELVSLAPSGDSALLQLEVWVEETLIRFYGGFRKNRHDNISIDPNVYLYSDPIIKQTARALLLFLVTFLLLIPVVIYNIISTTSVRIIVIMVSTISYLFILSELTHSRTIELILAGATYATVLMVFVSGTSGIST